MVRGSRKKGNACVWAEDQKGEKKFVQSLINTKENKNKSGKHLFTNLMKEKIMAEGCERWLFVEVEMVPEGAPMERKRGKGGAVYSD